MHLHLHCSASCKKCLVLYLRHDVTSRVNSSEGESKSKGLSSGLWLMSFSQSKVRSTTVTQMTFTSLTFLPRACHCSCRRPQKSQYYLSLSLSRLKHAISVCLAFSRCQKRRIIIMYFFLSGHIDHVKSFAVVRESASPVRVLQWARL